MRSSLAQFSETRNQNKGRPIKPAFFVVIFTHLLSGMNAPEAITYFPNELFRLPKNTYFLFMLENSSVGESKIWTP